MIIYDGTSNVDWFYHGEKTAEEMRADPEFSGIFDGPALLYDNGAGKVYDWEPMADVCARWCVPLGPGVDLALDKVKGIAAGGFSDPSDVATEAKEAATEAKAIAEQAGTDPQLQALATMQVATMDLTEATSTDCAGFRDYWPEWKPDTEYKYQQPLRHKGLYYRASKALTSSKVYPPDTAGESEYYPIEVAPDGVIVYRECHGEYDMVRAGETRHYPDAEGPVYRAKVGTAYDPDTVPDNWELA